MKIVKSKQVLSGKLIGKLGAEPLKDLTLVKFRQILAKTARPIKIVLMDQEKISGIGNIYANDALWLSGINPRRMAKSLNSKETKALFEAILKVLKEGIHYGGASDQHYLKPDGTKGEYQKHFLVYGRTGEKCDRCQEEVKRFALGGRGTFWCTKCQK